MQHSYDGLWAVIFAFYTYNTVFNTNEESNIKPLQISASFRVIKVMTHAILQYFSQSS